MKTTDKIYLALAALFLFLSIPVMCGLGVILSDLMVKHLSNVPISIHINTTDPFWVKEILLECIIMYISWCFSYGYIVYEIKKAKWFGKDKAPQPIQADSDAVDFMNWTLGGDCEYQCTDEDQWNDPNYTTNRITHTTKQLYEIWKARK